jgi:glyceraldehyde 3-phosphate dehydrogenase
MRTTRVGLMGFGRLGRSIFRILAGRQDIHVAALSELASEESLLYLLKYDSIFGRFPYPAAIENKTLYSVGLPTALVPDEKDKVIPWADYGVEVVIEATRRKLYRKDVERHLEGGAKRVIMCTPLIDEPDFTVMVGINENKIEAKHQILSHSSNTAHCAAPLIQLIDEAFGIDHISFSAVHAYTSEQSLSDVPAHDLRHSRAAAENIVPTEATSIKLLEALFPHLTGSISGLTLNVPVSQASMLDMSFFTQKETTVEALNRVVLKGSERKFKRLIEYCDDPIVSSDATTARASCLFDSQGTQALDSTLIKTIAWFNNGWGYCHRLVGLIEHLGHTTGEQA